MASLCRGKALLPGSLVFDVLESIVGVLNPSDRRTARLVNTAFRAAVSTHIRIISVHKARRQPSTAVCRLRAEFPQHTDIWICLHTPRDWPRLVDPALSPLVTRLTLAPRKQPQWEYSCPKLNVQPPPEVLPDLVLFQNLRWLTVGDGFAVCPHGIDVLLPHLPSLERIQMAGGKAKDVRTLQRMPNLMELDLVFTDYFDTGAYRVAEEVGFPKLRSLRIGRANGCASSEFISLVGRLTRVTSLTWAYGYWDAAAGPLFMALADLPNLRVLCLKHQDYSSLALSDMLAVTTLTGLTKLEFGMPPRWPVAGPSILPALSGLTCLKVLKVWAECQPVAELSALRVESLHRLELGPRWDKPDADGLAVLRRATNLTRLCFHAHAHEVDKGLGGVVAVLTRLRSLDIKYNKIAGEEQQFGTRACLIRTAHLAPLTGLTYLKLKNVLNEHADMASLAASLGNPAWFTASLEGVGMPGGGVEKGEGTSCASTGTNTLCSSPAAVSPCGAHMLGRLGPKDAEADHAPDPWAVSFGLEDKEEGYFSEWVEHEY